MILTPTKHTRIHSPSTQAVAARADIDSGSINSRADEPCIPNLSDLLLGPRVTTSFRTESTRLVCCCRLPVTGLLDGADNVSTSRMSALPAVNLPWSPFYRIPLSQRR